MKTERVRITDRDGNGFPMMKLGSLYMPNDFIVEGNRVQRIRDLESRPGDLMICTYPKTGTNWTAEMVKMLRAGTTDIQVLVNAWLAYFPDFDKVVNQPSPRLYLTHLTPDMVPHKILQNEKVILLCRNPKDNAVSLYHHMRNTRTHKYTGTWNAFLDLYMTESVMCNSFFHYYRGWDELMKQHRKYKILLVYYEDLQKNAVVTLRKICSFLEIERSDDFLYAVVERCQFETLKRDLEIHPGMQNEVLKQSVDGKLPFCRKGIVGDWKNHFTDAQNEAFERLVDEKLAGTIYRFQWEM